MCQGPYQEPVKEIETHLNSVVLPGSPSSDSHPGHENFLELSPYSTDLWTHKHSVFLGKKYGSTLSLNTCRLLCLFLSTPLLPKFFLPFLLFLSVFMLLYIFECCHKFTPSFLTPSSHFQISYTTTSIHYQPSLIKAAQSGDKKKSIASPNPVSIRT